MSRAAVIGALLALSLCLPLAQSTTISGSGSTTIAGTGRTEIASRWLFFFGDSKTAVDAGVANTWPAGTAARLEATRGRAWTLVNVGVSGRTVATTLTAIAATLAAMPAAVGASDVRVLINLGVNDITLGLPAEATWEANYLSLVDAIHTKWPTARIYVTRPWLLSHDTDANTVAGWIAIVVAARPSFLLAGPDERVWLKAGDNGATMTTDGTHFSVAGNGEAVNQYAALLTP